MSDGPLGPLCQVQDRLAYEAGGFVVNLRFPSLLWQNKPVREMFAMCVSSVGVMISTDLPRFSRSKLLVQSQEHFLTIDLDNEGL